MSAFDPNTFLDVQVTEALVKRPPLPVGDYIAIVGEPVTRPWVSKDDPTKSGYAVDYALDVDVPVDIRESLGIDSPTIKLKHGVMLDLNATGGIDTAPGKNGGLRRFRDALGMNNPGEPFGFRQATGRPVKVKIGHREYPAGSGELFEEILGLAKV